FEQAGDVELPLPWQHTHFTIENVSPVVRNTEPVGETDHIRLVRSDIAELVRPEHADHILGINHQLFFAGEIHTGSGALSFTFWYLGGASFHRFSRVLDQLRAALLGYLESDFAQ